MHKPVALLSPALAVPLTLIASAVASTVFAGELEEMVVTATHDTRSIDVSSALVISPDTSELLKDAPGANVNGNGPLTGIAQYRGMYGPRVATALDGRQLAPAGPNWMDPPLSYAAAGQLESLELYRGIAPVSVAQESIGGAIEVKTNRGEFSHREAFSTTGHLTGSAQSVNSGTHLNAAIYATNSAHRIKLAAMTESGDDADFPGGTITPSEYERQRYDAGYGFHNGRHTLQFDYSYTDTGDTGTAALPMDIQYIKGDLYSAGYTFEITSDLTLQARVYGGQLDHGMTNFHLREAPMPMGWRQNITDSDSFGYEIQGNWQDEAGSWIFGLDAFDATHNSDIDNPNNPMFFVVNYNDAEREVIGLFLERQHEFNARWTTEFGLRQNYVKMNAGEVDGTPAQMMPPAQALRDDFNNADRKQTDNNTDLVAKVWLNSSDQLRWYGGLAQKQRSASYQERYLWLPLEATGGLADGMTYTGNIELDPEVSQQFEAGLDFSSNTLTLSPRFFYNRVEDYIQGTPSEVPAALMFVQMMNMNNGTMKPAPLQFNNVEAELYGFDMDWAWQLDERWSLSGLVNYVRGKRRDIDDNLYRIAPANTSIALNYSANNWSASAESVLYASQDKVSETNAEKETAGYGVVNLRGSWQATQGLQLAAGVDNLFDKAFENHLGGYNRAGNPDIATGDRLPGYGRNVFLKATYAF